MNQWIRQNTDKFALAVAVIVIGGLSFGITLIHLAEDGSDPVERIQSRKATLYWHKVPMLTVGDPPVATMTALVAVFQVMRGKLPAGLAKA